MPTAPFNLTPEQALAFFRQKGLQPTFAWQEMLAEEHDHAFTVAKMADQDLLRDVRAAVERAIANGTTLRDFRNDLTPILQNAGWWGRQPVIDPLTGLPVSAQLGSPHRLEIIFRNNLQAAYMQGIWQEIAQSTDTHPLLMYDAVDDHRTRPQHASWDGLVYPVNHPFWRTHYPPNGWNCRCSVIPLTAEQAAELGKPEGDPDPETPTRRWRNPRTGEVRNVPEGIDPGWDHNPGLLRTEKLAQVWAEKQVADSIVANTLKTLFDALPERIREAMRQIAHLLPNFVQQALNL